MLRQASGSRDPRQGRRDPSGGCPPDPRVIAGLRASDLLLAAWNGLGIPLVAASVLLPVISLGSEPNAAAGVVQLLAVIGAMLAIATRPRGSAAVPEAPPVDGRLPFLGPLVLAMMLVAGSAATYLNIDIEGFVVAISFLAILAALLFADALPVVDPVLRRMLIAPFIAICAGVFNGFAADLLRDLEIGSLVATLQVDDTGFAIFVVGMLLAGLAMFYASLVVAPRLIADPESEHGWIVWPARFVLYVVSALFGIGWLAVIAG